MMAFKRFLSAALAIAAATVLCGAAVDLQRAQLVRPEVAPALIAETLAALQEQLLSATPTSTLPPVDTPTIAASAAVTLTDTPSPTPTPTDSPSPTSTDTPSSTPTETPTNTPTPPSLSVSAATNCYAGPSNRYGLVYTMRPGITALLIGMDAADSYWIISVPGYPGTVCWLSSQYAQVTGDTGSLPSPATPLASNYTLSEPKNLRISCSSVPYTGDADDDASAWTVVLRWTNTEPNQTGVRLYRYGRQIATLGSHASSYTDYFIHYDFHSGVRYGVQAVNAGAVSSIVWIHMNSCR